METCMCLPLSRPSITLQGHICICIFISLFVYICICICVCICICMCLPIHILRAGIGWRGRIWRRLLLYPRPGDRASVGTLVSLLLLSSCATLPGFKIGAFSCLWHLDKNYWCGVLWWAVTPSLEPIWVWRAGSVFGAEGRRWVGRAGRGAGGARGGGAGRGGAGGVGGALGARGTASGGRRWWWSKNICCKAHSNPVKCLWIILQLHISVGHLPEIWQPIAVAAFSLPVVQVHTARSKQRRFLSSCKK